MALTDKLSAIGNAIRSKTGGTEKLTLDAMVTEIEGITVDAEDIPEEAFALTGDCSSMFQNGFWDWFVEMYGDKITTESMTQATSMFYGCSELTEIPFDFNFDGTTYKSTESMFSGCSNLTSIGAINNLCGSMMNDMFYECSNLRYLPEFNDFSAMNTNSYTGFKGMFVACCSLRSIPEDFLNQLYTTKGNSVYVHNFNSCSALDEIRGLNPQTGIMRDNMFSNSFAECNRIKDLVFSMYDSATPYTVSWKNQTIDLSMCVGYAYYQPAITGFNSGITDDKEVVDSVSYASLKNDPDWFTVDSFYSRYNHDSAVNTINSLPDTSAYLAENGGTNTIKFKGASGSFTDGGAINTLTEEEIAVATAKGWTVSFA